MPISTTENCAGRSNEKGPALEHKAFRFELEQADPTGEFSGYAAVFGNRDSGDDIIDRGAFAKTIKEDFPRIKILALHNDGWLPVGRPIELREDDKGLFIRGKISDTAIGRDIRTLMKDGVLTELSIGYDAVSFSFDSETNVRHLKEIRLWEVSVVTWAMNEYARVDEVKSLLESAQLEAKNGKLSRAKLNTLRPFVTVLRELLIMLVPLLEEEGGEPQETAAKGRTTQKSRTRSAQKNWKQNPTNAVFEITKKG